MMHTIDSIEGIGPAYKSKFHTAGITTVEDFLEKAITPLGLSEIARASGFNEQALKRWAGIADLFRVNGVSPQWSELLNVCGIRSVSELATRNPRKLHKKMVEINSRKKICKSVPHMHTVKNFIQQAKELPKYYFT